jgi:cobalt-zinc-cadmium efflux system outer membrane protein
LVVFQDVKMSSCRRRQWLLALAFVALHSTPARAEAGLSLSLPDAIVRAEARAPEVALARRRIGEAEALRVGAGVVMPVNPRVSVDVRPGLYRALPSDVGYGATADALFEVGGAPGAREREAERHVELANAELRLQRRDARAAVWTAYVRSLVAVERIRETRFAIGVAERVLGASRQRAQAGAAGDIEQSLAEAELAQLRATEDRVTRERAIGLMQIRDVLDLPADVPLTLSTPLQEPEAVPDAAALAKRALAIRGDLETIRRRVDVLVATEERLQREAFPRVGGYVGVDASPLSPMFGIVGLSVELPVAQRNQGPRARVAAHRATELDRLEIEARRIVREVYLVRTSYESRLVELRRLSAEALPAAERTLDLVETGWRAGRFDIFRLTSAARDLTRVREFRLDALEAAWLERIALDRAVGGLDR